MGTATVGANGVASLTVTDQTTLQEIAALPPGSYELVEAYSGSPPFAGSSTTSTFTITPVPTTIVAPNVNITVNSSMPPTAFNITVNVNTPTAPVTSGTVTVNLVNGTSSIPLGTATIDPNGAVTLTVTGVPLATISALPPGTYQLVINFTGGPNAGSSAVGTMTIQVPSSTLPALTTTTPPTSSGPSGGSVSSTSPAAVPPVIAALELALDAAMLSNMGNPGSVGEFKVFPQTFLGKQIPTLVPRIIFQLDNISCKDWVKNKNNLENRLTDSTIRPTLSFIILVTSICKLLTKCAD